jgi:acyl carrier protein
MTKSERALQILSDISGTPIADLHRTQDLVTDLGIDSPKALRLLVELEDELAIEISDEAAARMTTVGDILDGIE